MSSDIITPRPEFQGILREQETYATGESDDVGNRINSWFDLLMIQSGMGFSPSMVLALSLCSGVALGGLVWVIQENLITAAIGAFFGFIAPIVIAVMMRARRQTVMMNQMPPMTGSSPPARRSTSSA